MKKLALTGGIGAGKSFVAGIMRLMGIPVYVSDIMAKRLMETDPELVDSLKREISADIYDANGRLDRKRLATMVFSDEQIRRKVESLVHPAVIRDYQRWTEQHADSRFTAFESAILFEAGINSLFDVTICVCAPMDMRIRRCMMRDGETQQNIEKRIAAQMPQDKLAALCNYTIVNDGKVNLQDRLIEILESVK